MKIFPFFILLNFFSIAQNNAIRVKYDLLSSYIIVNHFNVDTTLNIHEGDYVYKFKIMDKKGSSSLKVYNTQDKLIKTGFYYGNNKLYSERITYYDSEGKISKKEKMFFYKPLKTSIWIEYDSIGKIIGRKNYGNQK